MAHRLGAGEAFRSIDSTTDARGLVLRPLSRGHQRYVINDDYSEYDSDETSPHPRPLAWGVSGQRNDRDRDRYRGGTPEREWSPEPEHQFFVIREGSPSPVTTPLPAPPSALRDIHLKPFHQFYPQQRHRHQHHHHHAANPSPSPVACSMERTPSGRTILTETAVNQLALECADFSPEEDRQAALQVKRHMANPRQNVKQHERILRALIHPKPHAAKGTEFPLDNDALESIFSAADEIFFQGRLSRRVHWEWSSFDSPTTNGAEEGGSGGGSASSNSGSSSHGGSSGGGIIGTTALRRASPPSRGGYETLIVLSSPILMDTGYNRRLLISTFLHELIHSYLFICCGFKARHCGGHTEGFKEIAALIDEWAGRGTLRLCDMEADLEHFREGREKVGVTHMAPDADYDRHQGMNYQTHRQQQQNQPHHQQYHQNYQHQQHPAQQKRYHHHGGVDFYDLNESPWSTGPKVVFGSRQHQATSAFTTTFDSSPAATGTTRLSLLSSSPPPLPLPSGWNYPPRTRTPFSSPTPPPSMSTTPLSSATTLVGGGDSFYGREKVIMYEYEYEGLDGPGATGGVVVGGGWSSSAAHQGGLTATAAAACVVDQQQSMHQQQLQQYCHTFTGPEIQCFSPQ